MIVNDNNQTKGCGIMRKKVLIKFSFTISLIGIIVSLIGVYLLFNNTSSSNDNSNMDENKLYIEENPDATVIKDYKTKDFILSTIRISYSEGIGSAVTASITNNTNKDYEISFFEIVVSGSNINESLYLQISNFKAKETKTVLVNSLNNLKDAKKVTIKKITKEAFMTK